MNHEVPKTTHSHEMRDEMLRRSIAFTSLFSVVLGQLVIILSEIHHLHVGFGLIGIVISLIPLGTWVLLRKLPGVSLWMLILFWVALPVLVARSDGSPHALAALAIPVGLLVINVGPLPALALAFASSVPILASGARTMQFTAFITIWGGLGLTWILLRFAKTATHWSWSSYVRMRDLLEESRAQQLHLKEAQEDLNLANAELARLSDRLLAMSRIADEARRAKEEFVANVSHELRTPLNMIIGFSEIITENPRLYDCELPPQLLADIQVIQRNSHHLSSLVDDILDLSRAEVGRMALTREYASIREIVEEALATVRPLFESKNLYLVMTVADDLPPVYCDRTRIRQVIINLLSNAGRFTEHGGAHVRAVREAQSAIITVADTGPGVPKGEQQRIFEPFQQHSGGTASAFGGSGLGLAISRRFVEMHGGRMWLESEPGQGSVFGAVLPLDVTPHLHVGEAVRWFNPYETYEPRTRPWQAPQPVVRPRLVVMERSDTLCHILERYGPDVEVASVRTLDAAMDELSRLPARALLVNDSVPPAEAYDIAAVAANLPYRTPVIRCAIPDRAEAAEDLNVIAYLLKPIQREKLFAALAQVGKPVRSVLLVDDNPEALQLFTRMLSSAANPIDVYRASSGVRALSLMRDRRPDVVLLDLVMPEMDGFAVLQTQRQDDSIRGIPVIAISALDPTSGGYATPFLAVSRGGGINLQDLLRCAEALMAVLSPPDEGSAPAPEETRAD